MFHTIIRGGAILVAFVISLLAGFLPISREFSIQRACSFLPYFMMGYFSHRIDIRGYLNRIPLLVSYVGLTVAFVAVLLFLNGSYRFLTGANPYSNVSDMLVRLSCIVAAIYLSSLVMRITPNNSKFAEWGKVTLFIYMYHLFFEAILKIVVNKGYLPSGVIPIFIYSVLLTLFLIWASKIQLLNILLNPFTYFVNAKKR